MQELEGKLQLKDREIVELKKQHEIEIGNMNAKIDMYKNQSSKSAESKSQLIEMIQSLEKT